MHASMSPPTGQMSTFSLVASQASAGLANATFGRLNNTKCNRNLADCRMHQSNAKRSNLRRMFPAIDACAWISRALAANSRPINKHNTKD